MSHVRRTLDFDAWPTDTIADHVPLRVLAVHRQAAHSGRAGSERATRNGLENLVQSKMFVNLRRNEKLKSGCLCSRHPIVPGNPGRNFNSPASTSGCAPNSPSTSARDVRTAAVSKIASSLPRAMSKIGHRPDISRAETEEHAVEQTTFERRKRRVRPTGLPIGERSVGDFCQHDIVNGPRVRHPTRGRQREEVFPRHARPANRNVRDLRIDKARHLPRFADGGTSESSVL